MSEQGQTQWLSLSEASELIGVHPSTLRRWADAGKIACTRTPGGHRRFQRSMLEGYLREKDVSPSTAIQPTGTESGGLDHASLIREEWHLHFAEAEIVDRMRPLGQRLLGLLLQFLTRREEDERFLEEGREVGYDYGHEAYAAGIALVDSVEAFLFFRTNIARMASQMPTTARLDDGQENARLHRRIDRFMNTVLMGLITAYEEARGHVTSGGEVP